MGSGIGLNGTTILVTGVSGFVGSRVARRMAAGGARVRALVRRPGPFYGLDQVEIEYVHGDLSDPGSVRAAVSGTAAVVHCAGYLGKDPEAARQANVAGTAELAQAALEAGCRSFVHISTVAVFNGRGRTLVDDETPLWQEEVDLYAFTKAEAERAVREAQQRGLPVTILRPGAVMGAHPTSVWGIVGMQQIAAGQKRGYFTPLPVVHVDNLAQAVVLALQSEAAAGRAYLVIDDLIDGRAYHNEVRRWLGMEPLVDEPRKLYGYSLDRIRAELGYEPRHTFQEAMQEMREYAAGAGLIQG